MHALLIFLILSLAALVWATVSIERYIRSHEGRHRAAARVAAESDRLLTVRRTIAPVRSR